MSFDVKKPGNQLELVTKVATIGEFRDLAKTLRRLCPLIRTKVRVTQGRVPPGYAAYFNENADLSGGHIVVSDSICHLATEDCLIHEWTHAWMLDDEHPEWYLHQDSFWTRHGELYRAFHREK